MLKHHNHHEDMMTKVIENQTSKVPFDVYLGLAFTSMGASLLLKILGKKHCSLFVGQWAAPILIMGLYNKLVKQHKHW